MEFLDTLATRRSIRAFQPRAVAPELIEQILADATHAPSWGNTQPYMVAIATGPVLKDIGDALSRRFMKVRRIQSLPRALQPLAALAGGVRPDGDYNTLIKYPPDLKARYRKTGFGLYAALGIGREDRARRTAQMARNFRSFDAPVVLFVFAHGALGAYGVADTGAFLQSLALSAHDRGLGTCIQGALATWAAPVRKHFVVPRPYRLLCGVALGYPADDPVNRYRPERLPVSELLIKPRGPGAPNLPTYGRSPAKPGGARRRSSN
jgi:nitroreductase